MEPQRFSWRKRFRSFTYAAAGIRDFFRSEHNAWIHGVAAVVAMIASFVFRLSALEMVAIIVAIALVWLSEMFNTAIEKIMDHLSPAIQPQVKAIKDLAAAAVLVAALAAFIIGLIIFLPKLL